MRTQFTIYMRGDAPRVVASVYPDKWAHVSTSAYEDRTPILNVTHCGVSVTITTASDHADEANLRFARNLVTAANSYLAELERFTQSASDGKAAQLLVGGRIAATIPAAPFTPLVPALESRKDR